MHLEKNHFWTNHKEAIISGIIVIACLLLVALFPSQNSFENISKLLFFFLIVPALYIKLVLDKKLSSFGLNLTDPKSGLVWSLAAFCFYAAATAAFLYFSDSADLLSIPLAARANFWFFLLYTLVFLNVTFFLQEFFFKGFLLFSFRNKIGFFSAFLPFTVYVIFLLAGQVLSAKNLPFLLISLGGGILTYKTKSFIYSYVSGLIFLIFLISYLIYISKI